MESENDKVQKEEGSMKDELKEATCQENELIDKSESKELEQPEKETEQPKETKEEVEETCADATDKTFTEWMGDEHKAGVKARARRGSKKSKVKEKVEEHVVEEAKEEKEVQKEMPSRPEKTETAKQKAKQKAKKGETAAKPATAASELLQDTGTRDALLQALKQAASTASAPLSPSAPSGANDIPVPPPADPELHRLVSEGTSLLTSDSKKAMVLLRLAGRKGYLPAYLLLAQHAQSTQDDTLLIESLCALFTSNDLRKQLPQNVLSNIVMQLTAVLRDPKNRREAEAHAAEIEQIAKDWPIMNMLKLPPGDKSKMISSPSPVKAEARKSEAAQAKTQDFQEIKRAMATSSREAAPKVSAADTKDTKGSINAGAWCQEGGRWRLSIQADTDDLSTAELDISSHDLCLRGTSGRLLTKLATPENLDLSQVEALWSKKTRCLEVVGPSVKNVQEVPKRKTRHIDELD